jgi:hypothetical protein
MDLCTKLYTYSVIIKRIFCQFGSPKFLFVGAKIKDQTCGIFCYDRKNIFEEQLCLNGV